MNPENLKLIATLAVQLFLGMGAWYFGWRIAKAQIHNQKSDIRIKLYEQRYAIYMAFKEFIEHCTCNAPYSPQALEKFQKNTGKSEFLFGAEIRNYHREIIANAIAVRGILQGLPYEDRDHPVVGGLHGYFKGSTVITEANELGAWFVRQNDELYRYFMPYLDYSLAGVDTDKITMTPPELPEPLLIRRPLKK